MSDRATLAYCLLVLVSLSFCAYWLSEWLFLMSGLSFLRDLGFAPSLGVLVSSVVLMAAPLAAAVMGCALLWLVPSLLRPPVAWGVVSLAVGLQTLTLLLLLDNFTYTMFSFGIKYAGASIWLYRIGVIAAFVYLFSRNLRWLETLRASRWRRRWGRAAAGVLLISLLATSLKVGFSAQPEHFELATAQKRPNIIFLASDGLPSKRLSAYGASRDTTPFLTKFKDRTLFFSNAFSNAAATFPSTSSMLSGRSLFTTKTFYLHNPLSDEDADRHLPAILNQLGYSGIQVADRMYANSVKQNMRNSFSETFFVNISWIPSGLYHDVLFDLLIFERALVPVKALIGDGYAMVARFARGRVRASAPSDVAKVKSATRASDNSTSFGDQPRIDLFLRALETLPEPFYAHVHLSETHVAIKASDDHFDDTIEAGDAYFEQILTVLEQRGKLDNTIVIISSDHSRRRDLYVRVPLMIYFPGEQHTGVVDANAQLLDLPPTILSYLGQPIPSWMEGESLLPPESVRGDREIFGFFDRPVRAQPPTGGGGDADEYFAPLGVASLIRCDQWFYYSIVEARILHQGKVEGDRPSCTEFTPLSEDEAKARIERYLEERGVEASDMPPSFTKLL